MSTHSDHGQLMLKQESKACFHVFSEAIHNYCGGNLTVTGPKATAGIFATYPAPYLSLVAGFVDQVETEMIY